MAWRITKVEEERKNFINIYKDNELSMAEACLKFGISRKTGYKWIKRFEEEGLEGLKDRSKAPLIQTQKTKEELMIKILEVKQRYSKWGPKKILAFLENEIPSQEWPSSTTIGNILEKQGLTIPRKYRKRLPAKTEPLSHCQKPNDVWCIDFKGWFKTKDAIKCDPLTLTDAYSRYIIRCNKLCLNTAEYVWDVLTGAFKQYGMPTYLRHDNGPPFATIGAGRLSRLSIKLIKAGIIPEWIDPGKPCQNGRHERMHLTLKQEGIFPLELNLKEQQLKFAEFLNYFNFIRPHEALAQKTPASVYTQSSKTWTGKLRTPEYPPEYKIKRIRRMGQMAWYGLDIYIGRTLENEYVGLKETEDGEWSVYYGPVFLGTINHEKQLIHPKRRLRTNNNYYKQQVY